MSITVYGSSDDLIEVEGTIDEEFQHVNGEMLLAFSEGTVLRIAFEATGAWRIVPVVRGMADLTVVPAPEHDDDNYSDRAVLTPRDGDPAIEWVVYGSVIARAGA